MMVQPFTSKQKVNLANGLHKPHSTRQILIPARERTLMKFGGMLLAAPILCLLASCGSASSQTNNTSGAAPVTGNAVAATEIPAATSNIGINSSSIAYWGGSRPFVNLIYGDNFVMGPMAGGAPQAIAAQYFDSNGWVKDLPAGYYAVKALSIPTISADIVCTYVGNGTINVNGPVTNVVSSAGSLSFHYNSSYPTTRWATIYYQVDPTNYIRNIDCHEAGVTTGSAFDQSFVNAVKGYQIFRFMGWVPEVIDNSGIQTAFPTPTITWAKRNKPGDGDYLGSDGVPVELMVALANQANVDPWFSLPWNADDDYITKFATYVRDNLAPGRRAYIENSNEVWNWSYPVTHQAYAEAVAEGLPGNAYQQVLERYAEKTQHVMQIWSNVFAGQTNRIVRVAAFQNAQPTYVDSTLAYNNFASSVDAVATAPYWAFMQNDYTGQSLDTIMNTILPANISDTLALAAQNKATAQKYGLRYIAYEAGQHVVLPNNLDLLAQIERDPRMYDLYKSYINGWNSKAGGDSLILTNLQSPIGAWGAWGLVEWIGQPVSLSTTPKMQAVKEFLGTTVASDTTTSTTTPGTQVCPDGSIISATSTCPTAPTTSTQVCSDGSVIPLTSTCPAPTTTTTTPTSGKKNGATKGGGSGKGRTATA
jgi:hypothetical protein